MIEPLRAMLKDALFLIASMTKPITALGILLLADDACQVAQNRMARFSIYHAAWRPQVAAALAAKVPPTATRPVSIVFGTTP
jgi:hypothetical protein